MNRTPQPAEVRPPDVPALVVGVRGAALCFPDAPVAMLDHAAVVARLRDGLRPLLCHAPAAARRLGCRPFPCYDLLELFAFVQPARFCVPTPGGLAAALGVPRPADPGGVAAMAQLLPAVAARLLHLLATEDPDRDAPRIAWGMARAGWSWGPAVLAALGTPHGDAGAAARGPLPTAGFEVWRRLSEWSERAPEPAPGTVPVDPGDARRRLAELLGADAEHRPGQADYASAVSAAFQPRERENAPRAVLAEAGTGVGKTLGYIAPASLWAEANGAPVWFATYTRNLQHQIDGELDRLYADPATKARHVVLRKGRENYLCLLNFEEAVAGLPLSPQDAVSLGLMARWAAASRDGDMNGGDYPSWLTQILGHARSAGLADRRGECIYSACTHYHRCFIERSVRNARRARIVVANHALVMVQAALGGLDDQHVPTRYVFDEGHHLFNAADSAFSAHLTGQETAELRRWLLGAEGRRSRARGLRRRAEDLAAGLPAAEAALQGALDAARALPGDGWLRRLGEDQPRGVAEPFLARVRQQVYARVASRNNPYSLETEAAEFVDGLVDAAAALADAIDTLMRPLTALREALQRRLDDEADALETPTRLRIEAICRSLFRRGDVTLGAWRDMLRGLAAATPAQFVDWFAVDRDDGRDVDVGMHRHWIDPTIPFAEFVAAPAHGVLVTSATLTDGSGDLEADWQTAARRTGMVHLPVDPLRVSVPSPFDYATQTRVLIVTDVRKDDLDQVAAAYRALLQAGDGGGLGLFTAIARLRAVHKRIAPALEAAGIELLAQHVDGLDVTTLLDIFRADVDSCLLGTDAVRDGVDVPGRSLRLIVFDRVPWPRPDILHRARRAAYALGPRAYDDMITRLRVKQAFGRLVRRADDRGVFVLLDPMMPSRLAGAFPDGVTPARVGLAEAVATVRGFLRPAASEPVLSRGRPAC